MNHLLADVSTLQSKIPATGQAAWFRREGKERFSMPTKQQEAWHYTSLKALAEKKFSLALLDATVSPLPVKTLSKEFFNLVFVDGVLVRAQSNWEALCQEVQVEEMSSKIGPKPMTTEGVTDFEALNWSYFHQGVALEIAAGKEISKPIQIINFITRSGQMTHPRLTIKLGERSRLSLIETFISQDAESFQNSVCEVDIGRAATLRYLRLQDEHKDSYNIGMTRVIMQAESNLESLVCALGSKLSRHNLEISLVGRGARAKVQGLTLGAGTQHLDHNTLIDHAVGECSTEQLYKSVLNHQARSVFTGKVLIRHGSQKASSQQLNKNLLLSSQAEADSRPQLEILADDVKATHGATVGQLNSEEIFYLLSRAISKHQAIEMLSLGFIEDLVFQLDEKKIQLWLQPLLLEAYRKGVKA